MKLSTNFTLDELTKSPTALRLGINNTPGPAYINNLRLLCMHILQPVREYFGKPVVINSGYRSASLNQAMGGSHTSQHMYGQAADIEIPGVSNDILWQYIERNLKYDQVIAEYLKADDARAGWVHVSWKSEGNRQEALSCVAQGLYVKGLEYVA